MTLSWSEQPSCADTSGVLVVTLAAGWDEPHAMPCHAMPHAPTPPPACGIPLQLSSFAPVALGCLSVLHLAPCLRSHECTYMFHTRLNQAPSFTWPYWNWPVIPSLNDLLHYATVDSAYWQQITAWFIGWLVVCCHCNFNLIFRTHQTEYYWLMCFFKKIQFVQKLGKYPSQFPVANPPIVKICFRNSKSAKYCGFLLCRWTEGITQRMISAPSRSMADLKACENAHREHRCAKWQKHVYVT